MSQLGGYNGNAKPRQQYWDSGVEEWIRLSGDRPQFRDSWESFLRLRREQFQQSAGNAEPRQLYGHNRVERMIRLSGDLPQFRDSWESSLRFWRELNRQSAGIYEFIQDQRKGDGDPNIGRKLLSQSGGIYEPIEDQRKGDGDPKPGRKLLSQSGGGPWLEVSDRPALGGCTTLDCKARGFSTPDITVVWLRDGEPQVTRQEEPLLSMSGTYETGAQIDINPNRGDKYTCRVECPSLLGGLSMDWEPASKRHLESNTGLIIGLTVGIPLFLGVVLLVVYFCYLWDRRRRHRYWIRGPRQAAAPDV